MRSLEDFEICLHLLIETKVQQRNKNAVFIRLSRVVISIYLFILVLR